MENIKQTSTGHATVGDTKTYAIQRRAAEGPWATVVGDLDHMTARKLYTRMSRTRSVGRVLFQYRAIRVEVMDW